MHLASGIDSFASTATAAKVALNPTYAQTSRPVPTSETAYLFMLALIGLMILLRRRNRFGNHQRQG